MVKIRPVLLPILEEMLYELQSSKLEVQLIPGNDDDKTADGRLIRVAVSTTPPWYQRLCRYHPCTRSKQRSKRKDFTKIKRQYIVKVLQRALKNKCSQSYYIGQILDEAEATLQAYTYAEEVERKFLEEVEGFDFGPPPF